MDEEWIAIKRNLSQIKSRSKYSGRRPGERYIDEIVGLDLSMQRLKSFSPLIFCWDNLTTLCLSYNNISQVPVEIFKLNNLCNLDLSHNRIKQVPKELGKLCSLRELKLGSNLLSSVPLEFGMLYQIEKLDLDDNPLIGQINIVYNTSGGIGVIRYCRDSVAMTFPYWEREWVFIPSHSTPVSPYTDSITIGTYNILCPSYINAQNYSYVPSWAIQWENRKTTILQEITSYGLDILCVQEMNSIGYQGYFREQLKLRADMDSVFYQKSRAKTLSEIDKRAVDGCATFWKNMIFTLVEQRCISLSQIFPQKTIEENEHIANRILTKDNIALVVVLERKAEDKHYIIVVNTHIHWDPEYPDVKTLQGIMILKEIETISKRYPGAELVITGDFNSLPSSSLYELYSTGEMKPNSKYLLNYSYEPYTSKGYSHSLNLKDSYSFVNLNFTNFTPTFSGVIDYIWYNDKLLPICSLGPIDEEYTSKIVGLPTHHYPSDHLILVTQFKCRPGSSKVNIK
ncbi:CCR4-NOT transcription complex subunit 6 [Nematocida sp. AWRm80]|nr:CCR4-NOT transcription complex subunit 6 [Nematocida sp. AWRm80]